MTIFLSLEKWSEKHHKVWMDFLRIGMGIILLIKGFLFISDTFSLSELIKQNLGFSNLLLAQFVAFMHLLCGFLIIIGLSTRIACALMIPIVGAGVFFINLHLGSVPVTELLLSVLTLLLLIFFFLEGSGKVSVTHFLINSKRSRLTDESERPLQEKSTTAPLDKDGNIDEID